MKLAYDDPGRRHSRLTRLLAREHRELAAGLRRDWSSRAQNCWARWLARRWSTEAVHYADVPQRLRWAMFGRACWIAFVSQSTTRWTDDLCERAEPRNRSAAAEVDGA